MILLVAGVLIGFGAKTAGGCTSGNGLTGTSMLSRAALVATATFFGTAIVGLVPDRGAAMRLAGLLVGLVFGVVLCWTGMSDPDVIRGALLLEESYLFLFFASAVLVATVGTWLLRCAARRALLTGERIDWREPVAAPPRRRQRAVRDRLGARRRVPRADRDAARPGDRVEPVHGRRDGGRNLVVSPPPAVRDRRLELLQ